jgi:predicted outer membrane repeat protein
MAHCQPWWHKYSISAKRKNYEREAFMKILKKGMFIAFLLGTVIAVIAQEAPRSYYVRANGNDQNNNGRSETTPFKTLRRAIEVASQGTIRRITIIGTLNQASESSNSRDGVFVINYQGKEELTITGKPDASQQQKAILSARGTNKRVVYKTRGLIRFENIEISGANINENGAGIFIEFTSGLTLGSGTRVVNNITSRRGGGLYIGESSSILIEEGSEISQNSAILGGGIYVGDWGILKISAGNITGNVAGNDGGGLYYAGDESILVNVTVSGNVARNNGGGIYMKYGNHDNLVMDDCTVSNNKAGFGAGIYLERSKFTLSSGRITGNNAEFAGGGIYVAKNESVYFIHSGGEVSGNQAGDDGDDIFIQQ